MDNDHQEYNSFNGPKTVENIKESTELKQEEKHQGRNKKLTLVFIIISLFTLLIWQGINSFMFNQEVKTLQSKSNELQEKLDKISDIRSLTLVQVVDELKNLKKTNENIIEEYRNLTHQYRFTLPFLKTSSLPETLEARNKKLSSLEEVGNKLLSLVQRSEQIDKDVGAVMSSNSMVWGTIFSKMDTILEESSKLKSDAVQLVVPDQLKFYHDTFIEALSEKDLFLTAFNDSLHSNFNAYTNATMAVSTYNNAYFYWELDQAASYANEAEEYRNQAEYQLSEAESHLVRYFELKEKIKKTDDDAI